MKQVVCIALLFSLFIASSFAAPADCPDNDQTQVTLTASSGSFGCVPSGSYVDRTWYIQPNNGSIQLTFDLSGLEGYPYDYLIMIDGADTYFIDNYYYYYGTSYTTLSDSVVISYVTDYSVDSSFTVDYIALGDPCLYSAHRDIIGDSITCDSVGVVSSSWTVYTSSPSYIYLYTLDDVTVTIRDGNSPNSPIIYQGNGNQYYYLPYNSQYGYYYGYVGGLYTTRNVFYVEITSASGLGYFYLYSNPNDYCSGAYISAYFTAPSGTVTCSSTNAYNNYINIAPYFGEGAVEITFTDLYIPGGSGDIFSFFDEGAHSYTITDSSGGLPPIILSGGVPAEFYYSLNSGLSHFSFSYRIVSNPCSVPGTLTLTADAELVSCAYYTDYLYNRFESGYLITPQNGGDVTLEIDYLAGNFAFNVFEGTSADGGLLFQYINQNTITSPTFFTSAGPMYIQLIVDQYDYYYYDFHYTTAINADPCVTSAIADRYALFGTISCPSLPTSSDITSYWQITPGNGVISVEFNYFDMEPNAGVLRFYDDVNNPSLIQSFDSSVGFPKAFTSSTGSLLVELQISHSSPSKKRGPPYNFSFTYTAASSPCVISTDVLLISPTGTFGCPNGFGPNIHSTWLIAPHNGQINYRFDLLYLFTGYDGLYINIYDGYDNTGILLRSVVPGDQYLNNNYYWWYSNWYSNPGMAITGSSISDAIFVEFYSDSQYWPGNVYQEFQISYTTLGDACGHSQSIVLTEPKGVFGCVTGLNDDVRSSWLINPENDLISLVFLKLDLEDSYDYIEIYDGNSPNDPLIGNFTGNVIPTPNAFYSTGNTLLVIVNTDSSLNSGGFELAYTSGVGNPCLSDYNATYTTSFGEFGCPNGVQNGIHSFWTITVPPSQGVVVASFTEFSLELNSDFLYVYDGDNENAPLLATLTGSNLPDDITSTGRSLYFLLVTDDTIRSQGFYVKYTSIESDPCQTSQYITLTKNSDSFGCSEGSIAKSITSSWLISPNNRNIITLSFSVFNLASGDFITVYDGNSISDPVLGTFTGNKVPSFLVSTKGELLVVLKTSSFGSNSVGFRASYTTSEADPCVTSAEVTLVAPSGTFGCPNGVRNNVLSSWLLAPLTNNKLEITVEFLDLQSSDILTIYDGSNTANPIATLTGRTRSRVYTTTNSVALIVIQTDSSVESNGFNINYVTAVPPSPSTQPILPSSSRSPIDFSFTSSASPVPVSPSQTPVTVTPFVVAPSSSPSRTTAPSTSQIISSIVPSATPSTSFSETPSATPSPVPLAISPSPSNLPIYSIVPFSPSANPSATSSANPVRVVTDVETLTVQLECRTSGATCCNNFETVWATEEDKNYPTLVDVTSCIYNEGIVTVHFDQYGSNFFTVEEILRDYWDDGGCQKQDPLSGEECSVSSSALDTNIWKTQIMVVDSIPATPSPLPSYYYYYASSTSGSSILSALTSILFVALYLAL